jgi:hypothetical protein
MIRFATASFAEVQHLRVEDSMTNLSLGLALPTMVDPATAIVKTKMNLQGDRTHPRIPERITERFNVATSMRMLKLDAIPASDSENKEAPKC